MARLSLRQGTATGRQVLLRGQAFGNSRPLMISQRTSSIAISVSSEPSFHEIEIPPHWTATATLMAVRPLPARTFDTSVFSEAKLGYACLQRPVTSRPTYRLPHGEWIMTSKARALLRALAVAAVAAIALAGCGGNSGGSNEGSSGGKTRLTWFMWTGSDAEVQSWKHLADMVTQKYPDITITFQTASFTDYFTKLAAQASGGNAPCLLGMQSLRAPGLGQLLRPLDDLAKKEGRRSLAVRPVDRQRPAGGRQAGGRPLRTGPAADLLQQGHVHEGRLRVLLQIIVPVAKPALAVLAVFTFINYWNSFLWPLIIVNSTNMATVPLGLNMFRGQQGSQWHLMMAASMISMLASIVMVLLLQRHLVRGITLSGLGGRCMPPPCPRLPGAYRGPPDLHSGPASTAPRWTSNGSSARHATEATRTAAPASASPPCTGTGGGCPPPPPPSPHRKDSHDLS